MIFTSVTPFPSFYVFPSLSAFLHVPFPSSDLLLSLNSSSSYHPSSLTLISSAPTLLVLFYMPNEAALTEPGWMDLLSEIFLPAVTNHQLLISGSCQETSVVVHLFSGWNQNSISHNAAGFILLWLSLQKQNYDRINKKRWYEAVIIG